MTTFRLKRERRHDLRVMDGILVGDSMEACESIRQRLWDTSKWAVGVDTETTGCDPRNEHPRGKARVVCIQFAWEDGVKAFIPNWGQYEGNLRVFKKWLADEKERKVLHNAKYDQHSVANHNCPMNGLLADTLIMSYTHNTGEQFHGLKENIRRHFGEETVEYGDTFREPKPLKNGGFSVSQTVIPSLLDVVKTQDGITKLIRYATSDPWYSLRLFRKLEGDLGRMEWRKGKSYYEYYREFELPYTGVLYRMERRGSAIDVEYLEVMGHKMAKALEELTAKFYREAVKAGAPPAQMVGFNIGSAVQIGNLLEHHLGASINARTPSGQVATGDDVLLKVRGPAKKVVEVLLEWRNTRKLLTTYMQPLLKFADEYGGRVSTNYKQAHVATGRLSSSAPNLQNVPTKEKDHYGIRKAFVARKGNVVWDIDLSQIEMRLAAHFTNDELLIRAIKDGWDLHSLTATKSNPEVRSWVGVREVTPALLLEVKDKFSGARKNAKILNFGVLYGMGPQGYAAMSGASEHEATDAINGFFMLYPGLKRGIHAIQSECARTGYVRTILGRWVRVPGIDSHINGVRAAAKRQAFNYSIQGSAGDLLKMSMILIDRDERLKELGVEMNLQIHDELEGEMPNDPAVIEEAKGIIEEYVSHPYRVLGFKDLAVDTPAEIKFGASWAEAK